MQSTAWLQPSVAPPHCSGPYSTPSIPHPDSSRTAPAVVTQRQHPAGPAGPTGPAREVPGARRQAGLCVCSARPSLGFRSGEQNHTDLETRCLPGPMGWSGARAPAMAGWEQGRSQPKTGLLGVMPSSSAALCPCCHLPCSALFWGDEGWQKEGVGESLCFAVAVATVVSLVAGAHISCSQPECELVTCKQIIFFPLLEKSPPLPPLQEPEPRRCCLGSSWGAGQPTGRAGGTLLHLPAPGPSSAQVKASAAAPDPPLLPPHLLGKDTLPFPAPLSRQGGLLHPSRLPSGEAQTQIHFHVNESNCFDGWGNQS